jgi:hypothetical protein
MKNDLFEPNFEHLEKLVMAEGLEMTFHSFVLGLSNFVRF